jgi:hypothetical protein
MAVMLSALRADRPLPPGRFLVLISVSSSVDPRTIVRLEGLGQLKIYTIKTCGVKPVQEKSLNHLQYYFKDHISELQRNSKLLPGFSFIGYSNPDNNLESSCMYALSTPVTFIRRCNQGLTILSPFSHTSSW